MRSMSRASSVLFTLLAACGGGAAETSTTTTTTTTTTETVETSSSGGSGALIIGGASSNFGETHLSTGFLPDPHQVSLVSGASASSAVDVSSEGLSPHNAGVCTGYATGVPDYIVHLDSPGALLRFFVQAPGDTTLVINDGAGNWWCSDDDGGNLNPLIDIANPPAGQYDVWVGSYEAGANISATLSVSELTSATP